MKHITHLLLLLAVLTLTACGPKAPDPSIVLWEQPDPATAARLHAAEKPGHIWYSVAPTGSMEPFVTGGDAVVVDTTFRFEDLKPAMFANYLPDEKKLPRYPGLQKGTTLIHMFAAWSGDAAIMDGIANAHYERGELAVRKHEFKGRVVQVYTKRKQP